MNSFTRRHFLKHTSLPVASTLLNLQLASMAGADSAGTGTDRKSLVCIHFNGGLDGYHLLIPRDQARHDDYAASRSNLHLPLEGSLGTYRQAILPLNEVSPPSDGALYGVHAKAQKLADMFNGEGDFENKRCLSFVGNVGSLIKPLTLDQFFNGKAGIDLPVGIGGHFRQTEQWHTALPQGTVNLRGWLGRAADLIHSSFNLSEASMNMSLSGNNLMQSGDATRPFSFSGLSNGLSNRNASADSLDGLKNSFHRRLLGLGHENLVDQTFAQTSTLSLDKQVAIRDALNNFDKSQFVENFPIDSLNKSLENTLILIAVRESLGLCRQTFFVQVPGWDDHSNLPQPFSDRIGSVSEAIARFQRNAIALNLDDSIIGFTTSEFARTLRSTGAGSDHAWGGPQFVFGGAVDAGKVLGNYPNLALNSSDDTGRGGRILPAHSCDEYFSDILRWFGLNDDQLNIVLPNYSEFAGRPRIGSIQT